MSGLEASAGEFGDAWRGEATETEVVSEAHRRGLRFLDFPAQRHHHVLGIFATYAVLSDATAGGPHGRDLFDLRNTAVARNRVPAGVEFCLWHRRYWEPRRGEGRGSIRPCW